MQQDGRPLRKSAVTIYNTLKDRTDQAGTVRLVASGSEIAEWTGLSERRVWSAIKLLCDEGWLVRQGASSRYGGPNIYVVLPPHYHQRHRVDLLSRIMGLPIGETWMWLYAIMSGYRKVDEPAQWNALEDASLLRGGVVGW